VGCVGEGVGRRRGGEGGEEGGEGGVGLLQDGDGPVHDVLARRGVRVELGQFGGRGCRLGARDRRRRWRTGAVGLVLLLLLLMELLLLM